jgi:hypothetical protein
MADCSVSRSAITEWWTAYVNGQTYRVETVTATIFGPTFLTYTFPQLLLTLLQPGAVIIQVHFECWRPKRMENVRSWIV